LYNRGGRCLDYKLTLAWPKNVSIIEIVTILHGQDSDLHV